MDSVRKGKELELQVERLTFGGKGLARVNGFVVFLERTIPGQRVLARITRKKSSHAEARVLQVLEESPLAVTPRCGHFGTCGGCLWQNLPYDVQLQVKRDLVADCLVHLGGIQGDLVLPTTPSPQQYFYRNKMEFSFSGRRWQEREELSNPNVEKPRDFALGLHVLGLYDRVLDIDECHLQSPLVIPILKEVRRFALASGMPPYSTKTHTGFWRFLVIRDSKATGTIVAEVITAPHQTGSSLVAQLVATLRNKLPEVTTLVHGVSAKKAQIASADRREVIFGPGHIEEYLGDLRFRISPGSFFQTNSEAARLLLDQVTHAVGAGDNRVIWDLYCGTGALALRLASTAAKVIGFEIVPEAVADAQVNATLNGVGNCEFMVGDMRTLLTQPESLLSRYGSPEVVVTDPPRAGMHPLVVKNLLQLGPPRIIYVSCNPATLARDLKILLERYRPLRIQPVDLFPHTAHIEAVALLERR
ncbi:MAG TPA: 23S rRNA (uracil(1939)-C(5))-methyltransferase RlmD [Syntrophobacteria bacterium]|nr:23S rRNA (uracil(1939)-C(5))-methyltransferase RlmD [Syntrophobacteria bacterium]